MDSNDNSYNNNNNPRNNNSPHNYHSQHFSHNQSAGKRGMRSNEIPNHNFDDSVNRQLYEEVKKKEREFAEVRNKFMSQSDDFEKRHDRTNVEK